MKCPEGLESTIKDVKQGFKAGLKPQLTDDGTSGTYFLRDKKKLPTAVFKPIDEEAYAPNNPRSFIGPFG